MYYSELMVKYFCDWRGIALKKWQGIRAYNQLFALVLIIC